ncbi:MAG: hypothetical protein E7307_05255 [Butyrivibrio sp.]|nr:hypothetical protein [Butyrivibrio sp.]
MKKRAVALFMAFILIGSMTANEVLTVWAAENFEPAENSMTQESIEIEEDSKKEENQTEYTGDPENTDENISTGKNDENSDALDEAAKEELPQDYKVTLKASPGYFEIKDDLIIDEYEIYVTEGGYYGESYRYDEEIRIELDGLPEPVREGFVFVCWCEDEEAGEYLPDEKILRNNKEVVPEDGLVYHAIWEQTEVKEEPSDYDNVNGEEKEEGKELIENDKADDMSLAFNDRADEHKEASEGSGEEAKEDDETSAAGSSLQHEGENDASLSASSAFSVPEDEEVKLYTEISSEKTVTATISKAPAVTAGPYNLKDDPEGLISAELVGGIDTDAGKVFPYAKGGVKPAVRILFGDRMLSEGSDYTLSYANNKAVGGKKSPSVTVKGKGNFKGSIVISFAIGPGELEAEEISCRASDKVYAYKAGNYTTTVTVYDVDGKKLAAGTDYEKKFVYTYAQDVKLLNGTVRSIGDVAFPEDIVPADTLMSVEITGKGNYRGSAIAVYRMVTADIGKASVLVANQYYTGNEIRPGYEHITVKLSGRYLTEEDYDIAAYENNINKGKATVTLVGKGDYGGVKKASFTIEKRPSNFTVVYYGNRATSGKMSKQSSKSAGTIKLTTNKFTRNGYVFDGWNTVPSPTKENPGESFSDKAEISVKDKETLMLYAQWKPLEYTITYHTNGGKNNPENTRLTFTPDDDTFEIKAPLNEDWDKGFQFGGWYTDYSYKNKISYVKKGTVGNLNIYAKWIPYTYTVSFDGNGGDNDNDPDHGKYTMANVTFSYGVAKKLPANKFKKSGSVFMGWSFTRDGEAVLSDKEEMTGVILRSSYSSSFAGDFTLYAVWKNSFKVLYHQENSDDVTQEGEWSFPEGSEPVRSYDYGEKISLLTPEPVRAGFTFGGWFTDESYKKQIKAITAKMGEDLYLYPKWIPLANQEMRLFAGYEEGIYFIDYVTYGGTLTGEVINTYRSGNAGGYDLPSCEKQGDTFLGWYTDPSYKTTISRITENTSGDLTLYALWKNNNKTSYRIHFVADYPEGSTGRSGLMFDQTLKYNEAKPITRNAYRAKGYSFKCWSLLPASERAARLSADPDASFTYYGDKEAATGFEDPMNASRLVKTYQKQVNLYAVWEKDIYKVSLYNVNAPEIKDVVEEFTYSVDQEIVFDGPRLENGSRIYIKDEDEDTGAGRRYLAEPCKLGDTFIGWYQDAKFRKKVTGIPKGSTGNKVFYARWTYTHYTINYDLNAGGDPTAELDTSNAGYVTSYGDKYESGYLLATATRQGYGFGGWYKEASCRNKVGNIIGSSYVDMTVYAKWVPSRYAIVFDKNCDEAAGKTPTMYGLSVDREYKLSKCGFTRDGYEVVGWNTLRNPTLENPGIDFEPEGKIVGEDLSREKIKDQYGKYINLADGDTLTLYARWAYKDPADYLIEKYNIDNTGKEDATKAINAAILEEAQNGGGNVCLPAGTYRISVSLGDGKSAILMQDNVTLTLDENTILKVTPEYQNKETAAIIIEDKVNAHVTGGRLSGGGNLGDKGSDYGILIKDCTNVTLSGMEISGMLKDGINVATKGSGDGYGNHTIAISDCRIHGNRRSDITVSSVEDFSLLNVN